MVCMVCHNGICSPVDAIVPVHDLVVSTGSGVVVPVWLICDVVVSIGVLCHDVDVTGCSGW